MITKLDDADSSPIYSGSWQHLTNQKGAHEGTLSVSTRADDTVSFKFTGTFIAVVGFLVPSQGEVPVHKSAYTIDDSPFFFTFAPANTSDGTTTFFMSNELPSGSHTLLVRNLIDNAPYVLDYVAVSQNVIDRWWAQRFDLPKQVGAVVFGSPDGSSTVSGLTSSIPYFTSFLSGLTISDNNLSKYAKWDLDIRSPGDNQQKF
ncbi:hypothetical protein NLJ89_g6367 [Agrocybe chaxingu]|uniref:Uncharacterized protein n=1 Tax=Agrocybe chaxingu TaxID=84603 RepID=A0A9W8MUQ0_9AGAR|nr:hypothetical protein NLJ89_g6367 [Agrocybe chaxingu]